MATLSRCVSEPSPREPWRLWSSSRRLRLAITFRSRRLVRSPSATRGETAASRRGASAGKSLNAGDIPPTESTAGESTTSIRAPTTPGVSRSAGSGSTFPEMLTESATGRRTSSTASTADLRDGPRGVELRSGIRASCPLVTSTARASSRFVPARSASYSRRWSTYGPSRWRPLPPAEASA